jgi:hypothetical protein
MSSCSDGKCIRDNDYIDKFFKILIVIFKETCRLNYYQSLYD